MTTKPDNPPAFPNPTEVSQSHFANNDGYMGMTLRDWFAGQAIAGIMASQEYRNMTHVDCAVYAWETADAMLAERSKPQ